MSMSYGGDTINDTDGGVLRPISSVMRNRIINGDMRINQRALGTVTINTSGTYTIDRWQANQTSSGKFTVQQSSSAPTGFKNSYLATSTSAYAVSSSDIFFFNQHIEGFNMADLDWGTANAKTVTLSAWVQSSLTGTFGGVIANSTQGYCYPFTYSIPVANTWTQISVTVAGPTSGTWDSTNGIGMQVIFSLGGGSTRSANAGTWTTSAVYTANGATSVVGTNGATLYITGVQLEKGTQATGFEYRQYGTELQLCQRYCEVIVAQGNNSGCWPIQNGSTTNARGIYSFKVQKRAAPTFTNVAGMLWLVQNYLGNFTPAAVNQAAANPSGALIDATCTGLTQGLASMMLEGSVAAGTNMCIFTAEL